MTCSCTQRARTQPACLRLQGGSGCYTQQRAAAQFKILQHLTAKGVIWADLGGQELRLSRSGQAAPPGLLNQNPENTQACTKLLLASWQGI